MFIGPRDFRWTDILTTSQHDVYHLPGYCAIEARLLKGEEIAWYHEEGGNAFLIPLVSRVINCNSNLRDLISPYGYPGILSALPASSSTAAHILALFNREAASHGYVSSFIRLNPLSNPWQLPQTESWRQWFHGGTVSVDLANDLSQITQNYSENHRRNLRKAADLNLIFNFNQWQYLPTFIEYYRQTMHRHNARPYYFFPESYFQCLHDLLGERLLFTGVCDADGYLLAGGLFTQFGGVIQYHLGATGNKYMHLSPSKLMIHGTIAECKRLNFSTLHLGGGLGGNTNDGLFRFKKGFATNYHAFTSLRFIHIPSEYCKLKSVVGKNYNRNIYFPEYRVLIEE